MNLWKELWHNLVHGKIINTTKIDSDEPEKNYATWSKMEEQVLVTMVKDGVDDSTIAVALNRTTGAVYQRRMKLNREK